MQKKPSQSIRCPRYLVVKHFRSLHSFSHDQPCTFLTWNNAIYIDQRAKKRDSVRKKRCSPSYVLCAFIGKRKKKEEKLITWKPPRSEKSFHTVSDFLIFPDYKVRCSFLFGSFNFPFRHSYRAIYFLFECEKYQHIVCGIYATANATL